MLTAVARTYPAAWLQVDEFRAMRGKGLPNWPEWCFLPLSGAYAIVSGGGSNRVPFEQGHHVGILGALAAWRVTQGIYRYDPALYEALVETPLTRELPIDPLYHSPEWCVYIETPAREIWGRRLHGVWAHLEWTAGKADELRLVLDLADDVTQPLDVRTGLVPVPLILGDGGIAECLARVVESGRRQARAAGYAGVEPMIADSDRVAHELWPIISLILYLCASEPDLPARPMKPHPKRTHRGWRLFPADKPTHWDVGVRIGAALRRAYEAEETELDPVPTGRHMRPHVRRAHWHTFLAGSARDERRVKWLPPIPVNLDDPALLPATIRKV